MTLTPLLVLLACTETSPPAKDTATGTGAATSTAGDTSAAPDTGGAPDTGPTPDTGVAPDTGASDTASPDTASPDTGGQGADTGIDPGEDGDAADYCHVQWPCALEGTTGDTSATVYVWVYEAGGTPGVGAGDGVRVELGYGPSGSRADDAWTWSAMAWHTEADGLVPGDLANDEYAGALVIPAAGTWSYAARASADDGVTWRACDLGGETCGGDGSASWGDVGVLVSHATSTGSSTGTTTGSSTGTTTQTDTGTSSGTGTSTGTSSGTGTSPGTGTSSGTSSGTGSSTGTTTDTTTGTGSSSGTGTSTGSGSGGGTSTDTSTGTGGVDPDLGLADHCHLQWPRTMTGVPGALSDVVYAWVYEAGVTGVQGGDPRVRVELGVGPRGSLPDAAGWSWVPMDGEADTSGIVPADNDQFAGAFVLPDAGAWDYAARVTLDDGASWSYCDGDGANWPADADGSDDGYDPADAGQLVTAGIPVDYCVLQWPPTMTHLAGAESDPVYVRVYEEGVTTVPSAPGGVRVQVGVGATGTVPDATWVWRDAAFGTDYGNDDEYQGTLLVPDVGAWDYAGRASADGGYSWTLCDGGAGSTDGYQTSDAGKLTATTR